jgi:ankyrin repeat protein
MHACIIMRAEIFSLHYFSLLCQRSNPHATMTSPGKNVKRALFRAISRGDLESFTRILQQNRELTNYCDAKDLLWHIPPLHWACRYGRLRFVQVLLEQYGAHVNIQDALCRTALYIATYCGHLDLVQLLLDNDADLNTMDQSGETPLAIACNLGLVPIFQKLLDHGAKVDTRDQTGHTPLFRAISSQSINAALIVEGLNNNASLFRAPLSSQINNAALLVEGLLRHGAQVNVHNSSGETPLHRATTASTSTKVVELLLAQGAHLNVQDQCGTTSLLQAVQHENVHVAQLLMNRGANLNRADNHGVTPFVQACLSQTPSLVYLFLRKSPHVWSTCRNVVVHRRSDDDDDDEPNTGRKRKQSHDAESSSRMGTTKKRNTGAQPVSVL